MDCTPVARFLVTCDSALPPMLKLRLLPLGKAWRNDAGQPRACVLSEVYYPSVPRSSINLENTCTRQHEGVVLSSESTLAPSWRRFLQRIRRHDKPATPLTRLPYPIPPTLLSRYLPFRRNTPHIRIYRHLVAGYISGLLNGKGPFPRGSRTAALQKPNDGSDTRESNMAYSGPASGAAYGEPGARRKKLAGYLRAAKDIGTSYLNADPATHHEPEDGPGAFPDAAVVRNGNEEMILFPSYARQHVKGSPKPLPTPAQEMSQEDYWRREWTKHEDDNAIVDVDVRGWIYTPHRGPSTRKQRLLIGLARQLSGIPAPPATKSNESGTSSSTPSRSSSPTRTTQQEEDLIAMEAENIVRKGKQEESFATRGAYSEKPTEAAEVDSIYSADHGRHRSSYAGTLTSPDEDGVTITPIQKRTSWSHPGKMSSAELAVANAHLLTRLRPFMANPMANSPISAFFYSDGASRQQTVFTDASGHFTFRAALDFIPTHVRVLASEKLSLTEEVTVTSPHGVSMISDIDDTIKHSAISAGAREIFRNAFIRDHLDLTIEGVREWYTTLYDMGVKLHYVSNSPWQMYPILTGYFKGAQLPKGSFHLKQYSGMLQGIFEPVAERKKSSLDKIMRDFPDRKFILSGDSGEADLEVYTDVALDNPGRILGIFIRDVTTAARTGYFDSNLTPPGGSRNHSRHASGESLSTSKRLSRPNDVRNEDDAALQAAIAASMQDMEEETRRARQSINPDAPTSQRFKTSNSDQQRPGLPPRRTMATRSTGQTHSVPEEDLIDFSDPLPPTTSHLAPPSRSGTPTNFSTNSAREGVKPSPSPPPPPKPANLRGLPPNPPLADNTTKPPAPPRPRKSSRAVQPLTTITTQPQTQQKPSPLSQVTRQDSSAKIAPPLPARRTYREYAKEKLGSRPKSQPTSPLARPMAAVRSLEELRLGEAALPSTTSTSRPALPSRRIASSYTSSQQPQSRRAGYFSTGSNPGYSGSSFDDDGGETPGEGLSKKEALWRQRWHRAQQLLERQGVTLRTWRTGSDVADVCVRLVEMEMREIERRARRDSEMGRG